MACASTSWFDSSSASARRAASISTAKAKRRSASMPKARDFIICNACVTKPTVLPSVATAKAAPDALRIFQLYVRGDDAFVEEIQELVRSRLAAHEYPRHIAFVSELPKTPAGKVHRKVLRERELALLASASDAAPY